MRQIVWRDMKFLRHRLSAERPGGVFVDIFLNRQKQFSAFADRIRQMGQLIDTVAEQAAEDYLLIRREINTRYP